MKSDLTAFTGGIAETADAFTTNKFTAEELVSYQLRRIEALDKKGPCLNSLITLNPGALEEARNLDAERREKGPRSPLHGITIVLKDIFNTRDMPTTGAAKALASSRPNTDATLVRKLKDAGAIILAKANLHEMARSGTTVSSLLGQTLNPYDLTRTPGGSSGGTAAAVAAGFCTAGIGGDTVNSIRSPASAVSLVGLRPTKGLVGRGGTISSSETQDAVGPITRSVSDAALLLDTLAGYDPDDPSTAWCLGHIPPTYAASLGRRDLKGRRLGLLMDNLGTDPEVLCIMRGAADDFVRLGAEIVEINAPQLVTEKVMKDCDVMLYETKPCLDAYFASLGPNAPVKNTEELLRTGLIHDSVLEGLKEANSLADPLSMPAYKDRLLAGQRLRDRVMEIFAENRLDLFLYPHQRVLVCKIGEPQLGRNGIIASVTGFPAITVPAGFSRPDFRAPLGVPVGLELLGRPWDEPLLIETADAFEKAAFHRKPPLL